MNIDTLFLQVAVLVVQAEIYGITIFAWAGGLCTVFALSTEKEMLSNQVYMWLAAFCSAVGFGSWVLCNYVIAPGYASGGFPFWHMLVASVMFALGAFCGFWWLRKGTPEIEKLKSSLTKRTSIERNTKTDIREISKFLPKIDGDYDPKTYFKDDGYFLGVGESGLPIYWDGNLPHIQVAGTTGSGKGVFLGMISSQAVRKKEAVFFLDPKDDEWGPYVLYGAAVEAGMPFKLLDLRPGAAPQINMLEGASVEEAEELFHAGFGLADRGAAADFYRIADRKAASKCAAIVGAGEVTAAKLYELHGAEMEKEAPYFAGLLREMGELVSVNARDGWRISDVVSDGGAVYVIGSMRNARVIRMQRMILVRLVQLAERRDRAKGRHRKIMAVLDELKYHISRPALEALGAARDKGLRVVMAHQAMGDLRDCPADLDPDAVTSAVMENGKLKLIYKVEDPDTAEWLSRKSGRIQVDDEVRQVSKNIAQTETVSGERTIKQSERYFVDENMILNMPERVGVVFGIGLPKFSKTSHVRVEKKSEAKSVSPAGGFDAMPLPESSIDVSKGQKVSKKKRPNNVTSKVIDSEVDDVQGDDLI